MLEGTPKVFSLSGSNTWIHKQKNFPSKIWGTKIFFGQNIKNLNMGSNHCDFYKRMCILMPHG